MKDVKRFGKRYGLVKLGPGADSSAGSTIQHLALFELAMTASTREVSNFWLMFPIFTRLVDHLDGSFDIVCLSRKSYHKKQVTWSKMARMLISINKSENCLTSTWASVLIKPHCELFWGSVDFHTRLFFQQENNRRYRVQNGNLWSHFSTVCREVFKVRFPIFESQKISQKDKITTSSCIPGYDYRKGSAAHFWHSHMIGQEWMRIDFIKPTRVTGLQVSSFNILLLFVI